MWCGVVVVVDNVALQTRLLLLRPTPPQRGGRRKVFKNTPSAPHHLYNIIAVSHYNRYAIFCIKMYISALIFMFCVECAEQLPQMLSCSVLGGFHSETAWPEHQGPSDN